MTESFFDSYAPSFTCRKIPGTVWHATGDWPIGSTNLL